MGDLAQSVTRPLSRVLGSTLRRVVIRTLDGEVVDRGELADPLLYIGGEVRLEFETESVYVSWESGEGWPDLFSIGVRSESLFVPEATLRDWDVSNMGHWSACTGQRLLAVRVFAVGETPHVVELGFANGTVWFANGYEQSVGDGDDLIIRQGGFTGVDGARLVWSA